MGEINKKIGIVIPCIDLWDKYTKPCLESIKTKYPYQVVLIDNNSHDNTHFEATNMVGENFVYQRNNENWGCQKSWNFGADKCFDDGCDYVLIINNDILLHPDAIDSLVERFENASDDVVMISCMDVKGECDRLGDAQKIFELNSSDYKNVDESEHPHFSAFAINKKCWEEVGEFDEGFYPAYFEDNDLHLRIKLLNLKAICLPTSLFYHFGSGTRNDVSRVSNDAKNMQFENNRAYYIQKWGGMPEREKFRHPFNDENKSVRCTKQSGNN
jgi:hypothetical protein